MPETIHTAQAVPVTNNRITSAVSKQRIGLPACFAVACACGGGKRLEADDVQQVHQDGWLVEILFLRARQTDGGRVAGNQELFGVTDILGGTLADD